MCDGAVQVADRGGLQQRSRRGWETVITKQGTAGGSLPLEEQFWVRNVSYVDVQPDCAAFREDRHVKQGYTVQYLPFRRVARAESESGDHGGLHRAVSIAGYIQYEYCIVESIVVDRSSGSDLWLCGGRCTVPVLYSCVFKLGMAVAGVTRGG